ncbi:hypothetical protein LXJ59_27005, partial [Escherichia coli]|nr:hypothetical protein [Escherichia coli]
EVLVTTHTDGAGDGIVIKAAPADVTHLGMGSPVTLEIDRDACLVFGQDGLRVPLRATARVAVDA